MSEQMYEGRSARPELYINRFSATIVTLFKLLDGIVAGFSLYHIFRLFAPAAVLLTKGALDFNQALQMVAAEYGIPEAALEAYRGIAIGGMALPYAVWGGFLLVIIIGLLLVVIEAIALLLLRTAHKGAGFIRVIHQIYLGVCILYLVLFAYSTFEFFRFSQGLQSQTERTAANIVFIIFGVIYLIVLLLHLCYHKDIVMAMGTVQYEVETGRQGELRRTHLSGISYIFSFPYILFIILIVIWMAEIKSGKVSLPEAYEAYEITLTQYLSMIGVPVIMIIKHLSVSFCNRNLKRAR